MKNIWLLALNILLVIAVAILYFLHFSASGGDNPGKSLVKTAKPGSNTQFKMAYFEMDSLDQNFVVMKEVSAELNKKQDAKSREIAKLQDEYQRKWAEYMNTPMNQEQSELATNDLNQRKNYISNRVQFLEQDYNDFYMRKRTEVAKMIEDYLKEYNKEKNYSYIIMYEPGIFYFKDSVYNITDDLVKGLNSKYGNRKSKKN